MPVIAIINTQLQGFGLGGPNAGDTAGEFGAVYSCDSTGQQILKLVASQGISLLSLRRVIISLRRPARSVHPGTLRNEYCWIYVAMTSTNTLDTSRLTGQRPRFCR